MSAPAPPLRDARARLAALFAKIDTFFTAAEAREGAAITCHAGCSDCCRRFTVTGLEAEVIREGLGALPAARRDELAIRAADPTTDVCPALDADGRCAIYAHRPVICRTHGLPIRFTEQRAGRSLPMLDACPKNFVGRDLASVSPASVMDQTTLSTILGALDAADAAATGRSRGERVAIVELLATRETEERSDRS
jgi:Fe-S-cluster containining protein